jgi:hypothetical protein
MYDQFALENIRCWNCNNDPQMRLDIAHIIGGSGRTHDRRNILRLCRDCHRAQHGEKWPGSPPQLKLEHMLWLKRKHDIEFYDREYLKGLRIQRNFLPRARKPEGWDLRIAGFQHRPWKERERPW